jgi:uncharacterized protein (DUF1778 family)
MTTTPIRWPEEALALVDKAVAFLHSNRSEFVRQAAVEKARLVLGQEPRLPVYKQGSRVRTDQALR